jgi:glutamate dehydrogenase
VAGLQKAIAQLMEGRPERPAQRTDPAALAQLLGQLGHRVVAADRAAAEAFARELFGKAHALLAEAGDGAALAAMTASAFAFVRDRGPAPLAVRVFTPNQERDGWDSPLTVVESVVEDRPFIVDTLCEALAAQGAEIRVLLHPVLGVERAADGSIVRLGAPDSGPSRESFFHAEVAKLAPSGDLQRQLADRLRQVLRVTGDYRAMRDRVAAVADALRTHPAPGAWEEEREELAALLDWLGRKSFVYLGYREYDVRGDATGREATVRPGSGLGLLRDDQRSSYRTTRPLPPELARRLGQPPLWVVAKTRAVSPLHRAVPMDDIAVKELDAGGAVVGVRRLIGLFTAKAYADAASELPILRRRLATILAREGLVEDSHDYRDLVGLFNSMPREELLASELTEIHDVMHAIRAAAPHGGIQVICRADALRQGLFTLVLVPRARFSTELHARVADALRRQLRTPVLQEHLALDERPVARLHAYGAVPTDVLERFPVEALQAELNALLRTWDDDLREALAGSGSRPDAERVATRYGRALPAAYKAGTAIADAVRDVRRLDALCATGQAQIELVAAGDIAAPHALKLYLANESLVLSEFVPVLENLGLRVLGQDVVTLKLPEVESACIHTFAVEPAGSGDLRRAAAQVIAALHALRAGAIESDRLNTLTLTAGLDWPAVDLLRAYVEHACQIGLAARQMVVESLTANPASAARLFGCFAAAFDPTASPLPVAERTAGPIAAARAQFLAGLDAVQSLAHDHVLRALADAVAATVRTNFYGASEGAAIALKLDCGRLPRLPAPRPAIETWVHGAQMAGVHLRSGRVARGGIRASERPDDFRDEILGLMRTQVVKNAVIVPVGAKGGFVVKGALRGAPADPARIAAAYRLFIDALLSITDNIEGGQLVAPRGQLVYDGPDPYLVVAADKGTATFSDMANEVAAAHRFWLGDAFASGGEHGYDHKRLAITARGAWECARQHFHAMQRDLDRETVSVAGIGDMSGDVFGNGLLRSRHLRLLAAFNHRDIFLDPDPDPALSYQERERLFRLPHSGWSDYAPTHLSRGGGVYARSAKSIALAPEARALLGLDTATPSGEEVARAILRLPVDLLWNGGVGTYVKASDEHHVDVADPGNDAVRIDARELRAAVVAEGGNLGLTQRARIEYALAGGHINSDAIDNSGGVDLSDHEVNLKIALQPALASGELSVEARHALIAELAEPVCEAVLAHNRSQAAALGLDQLRSRTQLAAFRDLITILEAEAGLARQLAHLPSREALRARRGTYLGLTRPELAVLMAHTKLDLQRRIVQSPLSEEPGLEGYLRDYFPSAILRSFSEAVLRHPLRREIIAVGLANDLVDTMGMTFLVRAVRDTGRDVLEVVRAWSAAGAITESAGARAQLAAVRQRLTAAAEQRAALELAGALERAALWLVQMQPPELSLTELVARFREPVATLLATWPERLTAERRDAYEAAVARLAGAGVDAELAARLVLLGHADQALEVVYLAHAAGVTPAVAAQAYVQTADLIDFDWLRRVLPSTLPGEDRWEPRAVASLLEVVLDMRRQITLHVLGHGRGGAPMDECLQLYASSCREQLDVVHGLISDLKAAAQPTLPALLVIMREVGRLARPPELGRAW